MAGILAPWHWVTLVVIIGVLFLGHKRLPGLGRALGQAVSSFKKAWKEGSQEPDLAEKPRPKRYPPSIKASSRQGPPRPAGPAAASSPRPAVGLLRFLLRSQRRRRLVFWSLLVLGIAYVAATLTDGLFSTGSFRSKAIAFLVFFVLGCVLLAVYRLSQRQKVKALSRPDR